MDVSSLATYLHPELVTFLQGDSRKDAIETLVERAKKLGKVTEGEEYLAALEKREGIISTGIGMGVAIPHAKLDSFQDFFIAVGIKRYGSGIEWDSLDGSPVRIVFLIGGPISQQTAYLKLLSQLTKVIKQEKNRQDLLAAQSAEEVIELLSKTRG